MWIDAYAWPQAAAILLLVQRGLEELYARRNTRRLLAAGAVEAGAAYYPVVAVTHLAWIAGIALLIPIESVAATPLLVIYALLQVARYWIIATLGRFWTHRILTLPGAPIVRRWAYAWIRHPNYAVTLAETFVLPCVFGAVFLALIMTAVWGAVLQYKIVLEDAALADRRVPPSSEV